MKTKPSTPRRKGAKMPAETLEALNKSIAHWERMASGKQIGAEEPYSTDCPLCALFYLCSNYCRGCPVYQRTGIWGCVGSPYLEAQTAFEEEGAESSQFKAAAAKELKFLKSLLPKSAIRNPQSEIPQ